MRSLPEEGVDAPGPVALALRRHCRSMSGCASPQSSLSASTRSADPTGCARSSMERLGCVVDLPGQRGFEPPERRFDEHQGTCAQPGVRLPHGPGTGLGAEVIDAQLAIESEDAKSAGSLGFMARALVLATMPYKDPKTDVFMRRNGDFRLRIVAGYDGGIPYGIYPRLLMSWVATEAVRRQSPVLELGDSLRGFLREVMDIRSASGGSRGAHTRVSEQMKAPGRTQPARSANRAVRPRYGLNARGRCRKELAVTFRPSRAARRPDIRRRIRRPSACVARAPAGTTQVTARQGARLPIKRTHPAVCPRPAPPRATSAFDLVPSNCYLTGLDTLRAPLPCLPIGSES